MILESPTSTAALLGQTERGPLTPRLVTSLAEFKRLFGTAPAAGNYLADAAEGFFLNGGDRLFIARIVSGDAISARSELLQLQAIGPGAWGNRIFVQLSPNGEQRFSLRIACFGSTAEPLPANPFQDAASIMAADSIETFEDLQALDPRGPDYWRSALAVSLIVRCLPGDLALSGREVLSGALAGGSDGSPIAPSDFLGLTLEEQATGLLALSSPEFAEVTLLAAPGVSDHDFLAALCAHCQSSRYRFAVLDGPLDPPNILELDPRTQWDTSFAAFYVPWLKVGNDGARIAPPSGHVLGIFARTDREQGIWKAPANQLVVGAAGLRSTITQAQQEVLNPRGLNIIRNFPGRGIFLWGARTLSSDSQFKYVPVRRFLSWIERSVGQGIEWAVFEPQGEETWARVVSDVSLFLRSLWRAGALCGVKEEHAFFVRCDRTTMTDNDIELGRLVCEIGAAPLRPAEFITFRLVLPTAA